MNTKKVLIILAHAVVGWALCGAIMFTGMALLPMQTTLIVHAVGAPIIFTLLSWLYFTRFNFTTPIQTAIIFTGFVVLVDFFLVALVINRSLEMFTSPLGTWIPFALIFASTYLTGLAITGREGKEVFAA
ncbi:MAG: hypothetical protein JXJ17_00950 [Anaerolineae bacterium]|nr:hypothetical protein [Anaerolineae bacterium]